MPKILRAASPYRLQRDPCVGSRSKAAARRVKLRLRTPASGQSQRQYSRSDDISLWPGEPSFAPPVVAAFPLLLPETCGSLWKSRGSTNISLGGKPSFIPSHPPPPFSITGHSLPNPAHPSIMPIQLFMEPHGESAKGADPAKNKITLQKTEKERERGRERERKGVW